MLLRLSYPARRSPVSEIMISAGGTTSAGVLRCCTSFTAFSSSFERFFSAAVFSCCAFSFAAASACFCSSALRRRSAAAASFNCSSTCYSRLSSSWRLEGTVASFFSVAVMRAPTPSRCGRCDAVFPETPRGDVVRLFASLLELSTAPLGRLVSWFDLLRSESDFF